MNIIQNSVHATSVCEHPTISIRTYEADERIVMEIEDNGCGIPEQYVERIFEPAFTLKGTRDTNRSYRSGIKGTGYGMANIKRYIEQHKGMITIRSSVGEGTLITLSLPVIRKELLQEEIIELEEQELEHEKRILLVEDEEAISDVQYRVLTGEPTKHKVDIATGGQMAKDLFDRGEYDLGSLDYVLPGEISGMDVYRHIRTRMENIPVLFISGNLEFLQSIKELQKNDPYLEHLSKPSTSKEYVSSINRLLSRLSVA